MECVSDLSVLTLSKWLLLTHCLFYEDIWMYEFSKSFLKFRTRNVKQIRMKVRLCKSNEMNSTSPWEYLHNWVSVNPVYIEKLRMHSLSNLKTAGQISVDLLLFFSLSRTAQLIFKLWRKPSAQPEMADIAISHSLLLQTLSILHACSSICLLTLWSVKHSYDFSLLQQIDSLQIQMHVKGKWSD